MLLVKLQLRGAASYCHKHRHPEHVELPPPTPTQGKQIMANTHLSWASLGFALSKGKTQHSAKQTGLNLNSH